MRCIITIRRQWRSGAGAAAAVIVLCMVCTGLPSQAQQQPVQVSQQNPAQGMSSYGSARRTVQESTEGAANTKPAILTQVGIDQHLNTQLPLNLTFTDDTGRQVHLGDYLGKRPAILALVYYRCPMLCSEEMQGLASALKMVRFVPGKDFNIIFVSIDPTEGTDLAAAKKATYLKQYGHPETADGWHFLTGTQPNIDALTKAVGFRYVKLKVPGSNLMQFAHASSIQIVTPEGKLAQYYMGVQYSPKDLLLGLNEASSNRIGSPVDNILTYCYHYDPQTNTHTLVISRVLQLGALLTLILLGGFMVLMLRRDYRHDQAPKKDSKVNG
ncbi:MAG TPA: SCO family protein [Terracidiphilus sp.]|nr:SCO family protein [Terracidiphilus sp.]